MTKRMSYTVVFKLIKRKQRDLEEVHRPEVEVFRQLKSKFSPRKYRVRLILGCDLYSGKYGIFCVVPLLSSCFTIVETGISGTANE